MNIKWTEAKIKNELKPINETRPGSLLQDKYAIAVRFNDVNVGQVSTFLSRIMYIYLKHGGNVLVNICGERWFSHGLNQGGMELPATHTFTTTDTGMYSKLIKPVGEAMEK